MGKEEEEIATQCKSKGEKSHTLTVTLKIPVTPGEERQNKPFERILYCIPNDCMKLFSCKRLWPPPALKQWGKSWFFFFCGSFPSIKENVTSPSLQTDSLYLKWKYATHPWQIKKHPICARHWIFLEFLVHLIISNKPGPTNGLYKSEEPLSCFKKI